MHALQISSRLYLGPWLRLNLGRFPVIQMGEGEIPGVAPSGDLRLGVELKGHDRVKKSGAWEQVLPLLEAWLE